jgi:methionyl-tRNA synthetase
VPVPGSNDVIYVWFDALANYLTGLGYGSDETLFRQYWAQQGERTHFVGKGISKFHAIYWPAILLSAGVLLPSSIFVHGYLTVDGERSENRRATASMASWSTIRPRTHCTITCSAIWA